MANMFSRFREHNAGKGSVMRYLFVTMTLLSLSVFTALVSQVGEQTSKVDALFFASLTENNAAIERYNLAIDSENEWLIQSAQEDLEKLSAHNKRGAFRDIRAGQIWRLVTPMFIHLGILHIVFNMMWLWQFGIFLETRFGSQKYLCMVLVISAVANITQAWFVGPSFGGMSGVNYGMFGFLMMRSWLHPDPGFTLRKEIVAWMLIWLVVCMTGSMGPVANHAHVGGMVCGGIFGTVHALRAGAWSIHRRRAEFRSAYKRSDSSLYNCLVCGATEVSQPERTFAVASDGKDYCDIHLPSTDAPQ